MAVSSPPFVELCAKTNFSFLEGASHPEEMIARAAQLGFKKLGLCDTQTLSGIPRAYFTAKKAGLSLIIGAELNSEIRALCMDREGYGNLCEIITHTLCQERNLPSPNPLPWLLEKSHGLILLVSPLISENTLTSLKPLFEGRLYQVFSQFEDGHTLTLRNDLPTVASQQPLYHDPSRKLLQDTLTCIRHRTTLKKAGFLLHPNPCRTLTQTPPKNAPVEWLTESLRIADRCQFSLEEICYHYPNEWIPEGHTAESYLEYLVWESAKKKYGTNFPEKVSTQIQRELTLIRELHYADYFLTTWDIVRFARSKNILCQGRGSAANSITCFLLGITSIDPIRMDLLFERFLSRERKEPPDIDIDFEHERREEVIQYLYERYGRTRAAITATHITYRKRSALREVGKVFELSEATIKSLQLLVYRRSLKEIPEEEFLKRLPELTPRQAKQYCALIQEILQFPRHLGTHVGGFVLCHDKLSRNMPIQNAPMQDRSIVQWDKNDLDQLGFVRVDVLGLGILTALRKSFEMLNKTYGISLDLASIPPEDPKVYDQICKADTVGVFQIESRAQMNMLPRLKPRNFFDLVVEISLVRPGPIQGEMVHPYLRRRAGKEAATYPHPTLRTILQKTYGVPIFQEQIMKMAMEVAGFTGGEADELRRAMGSWRKDGSNRLSKMGEKFQQGLIHKGIAPEFAKHVFHQIEGFAEYGFPESHAASFAILAYSTAYLKHYYPDVFLCALLNSQPMGFYSSHTLIHDGKRHGVEILPVDIQRSYWDNTLEEKNKIRLGFREVFGLSQKLGKTMEDMPRQESFFGFIKTLKQALAPTPLTKRDLFFLASANAFESVALTRRQAFWEIQSLDLREENFLSYLPDPTPLPSEHPWEKITSDYKATGVSLYQHPISYLRPSLEKERVIPSHLIKKYTNKTIKVAGMVISRQMPPTASGVLFITLEDEFGFANLVLWKSIYEKYRETLITHPFLLCTGKIQKAEDGQVYHVLVEKVSPVH